MGSSRPTTPGLKEKLYLIRSRLGLSQAEMVELLNKQRLPARLRIYPGNISRFEQGIREPTPLGLLAYSRAVGVSVEVLIDSELEIPHRLRGERSRNVSAEGGKAHAGPRPKR